jgi:hypothetical protein
MRNFSTSPPVIHPKGCKLRVCALAVVILASACSQAISGVPTAGISDKVAAAVTRAASRLEAGQALDGQEARSDAEGRLEVYVHVTDTSADSLAKLEATGLKNAVPSPAMGLVQGWIAPRDISALAALTVVTRITLPQYARHY